MSDIAVDKLNVKREADFGSHSRTIKVIVPDVLPCSSLEVRQLFEVLRRFVRIYCHKLQGLNMKKFP
jgi:hypothetical protein